MLAGLRYMQQSIWSIFFTWSTADVQTTTHKQVKTYSNTHVLVVLSISHLDTVVLKHFAKLVFLYVEVSVIIVESQRFHHSLHVALNLSKSNRAMCWCHIIISVSRHTCTSVKSEWSVRVVARKHFTLSLSIFSTMSVLAPCPPWPVACLNNNNVQCTIISRKT